MNVFDATVSCAFTRATGGIFETYDASFGHSLGQCGNTRRRSFMVLLAALPFVRYVQLLERQPHGAHVIPQVAGAFLMTIAVLVGLIFISIQSCFRSTGSNLLLRESIVSTSTSIIGYRVCRRRYMTWARFPCAVLFHR